MEILEQAWPLSVMPEDAEEMLRALGASIRSHRLSRGWSQEVMAEKLNVSAPYIGLLERGERTPALPVLMDLVRLFETSLDVLFGLDGNEEWLREANALLRTIPPTVRPTVLAMLKGVVAHTERAPVAVRRKKIRQTTRTSRS